MAPVPSKLEPRVVPSTSWQELHRTDGGPLRQGGVFIEPNVDTTCFTIRQINIDEDDDLIHVCDWPELRATIDQFMADRAAEAGPEDREDT